MDTKLKGETIIKMYMILSTLCKTRSFKFHLFIDILTVNALQNVNTTFDIASDY